MLKSLRGSLLLLSLGSAIGCVRGSTEKDVSSVHQLTHGLTPSHLPADAPAPSVAPSADPSTGPAARGGELTVEDAVRLGLQSNASLRADLRRIGVARGERVEASVLPNPTVELELLPERDSDYELRLEYEIAEAIFSGLAARAYEPAVEAERLMVASRALSLATEIRAAYLAHQVAIVRRQVAEAARDGYESALRLREELLRVGSATELETGLERLAFERSKVLIGQLKLNEVETKLELSKALGVRSTDVPGIQALAVGPLAAKQDAAQLEGGGLVELATQKNLELKALEVKAEGLGRRLGLAQTKGWVPRVAADIHALHTRPEVPGGNQEFRYGGGITLEVPLFDRNQGHSVVLDAELGAALEEYQALRLRVATLAEAVTARSEATLERVRLFEGDILPAQDAVTEQMRLQYNAMQVSLFDLLRVRQEQLDLKLAYYDARSDHLVAELERAALLAGATIELGTTAHVPVARHGGATKGGH